MPEARGYQCDILRLVTGKQGVKPVAAKVSKQAYVLAEHMNQVGNMKNHSKAFPTLTMAVAFCFSAIELAEVLARDLR
jgi:glycine cleavage system pyridoxal-binding protein P